MRKSIKAKSQSRKADETQHLIDCYATLLGSDKAMFRDESLLPASKETLKRALWERILDAESEEVKDAYKAAYLFLSSFVAGVGLKGIELSVTNIKEWGELSEIMNTELNELKKEIDNMEEKAFKKEPSIPQTRGRAA